MIGYKTGRASNYHTIETVVDRDIHMKCLHQGWLYYQFESSHSLITHPLVKAADVIHFHNLHGDYFNPFSISALSHFKPVVWSLRDMQSLTGHCAYSFDCNRWQTGCHSCPYLSVYPSLQKDTSAQLWHDKKLIYDHSYLWIVAISNWMYRNVKKSILRHHPSKMIHNFSDPEIFKPFKKSAARNKFGLPEDKLLIGASANGGTLANIWKGGEYTLAAIEWLVDLFPNIVFVNIGTQNPSGYPNVIDIAHFDGDQDLAQLYSALDLFLLTPRAEAFGLVVLEALSCGVPVVTFGTGGVPDIVRDGIDGFVVDFQNVRGLVKAASTLILNENLRNQFAKNARQRAVNDFSPDVVTSEYIGLYKQCIAEHPERSNRPKMFPLNRILKIVKSTAFLELEHFKSKLGRMPSSPVRSFKPEAIWRSNDRNPHITGLSAHAGRNIGENDRYRMSDSAHFTESRSSLGRRAEFKLRPPDICVCAYSSGHSRHGDHFDLISRCLLNIVKNTSSEFYRLHIGCNNLSPRCMALVDWLVDRYGAKKYIGEPHKDSLGETIYPKYPLMRKIYEATNSDWVIWFDDDCYVNTSHWLKRLQQKINATPNADQFGDLATIVLSPSFQSSWIEPAVWYNPQGIVYRKFPEGRRIVSPFIRGGFYAISRTAIEVCDVPDRRLSHNDGDWTTGMALAHRGYGLAHFLDGITIGDEPRRGIHENMQCPNGVPNQKEWSTMENTPPGKGAGTRCSLIP